MSDSNNGPLLPYGGYHKLRSYKVAQVRARSDQSDKSDSSDPLCPPCQKPMTRRKARSGARVGQEFWGCTAYPACQGLRQ